MERDWAEIERHLSQAVPAHEAHAVSEYVQRLTHERFIMENNIKSCARCALVGACSFPVPGTGDWGEDVMFIGEAPAEHEGKHDMPFVGVTGQLLTWMLMHLGVDRRRVYMTNAVKCAVPSNGPTISQIRTCTNNHLWNEIDVVRPRVILTIGNPAMWAMRPEGDRLKITKERGVWQTYYGIPLMHTYHPSFVIRQRGERFDQCVQEMMSDLSRVFESLAHPTSMTG